jgi:ParB family chromosome partitioning protein
LLPARENFVKEHFMTDQNNKKRRHLGRGLESLLGPIADISLESQPPIDGESAPNFPPDKDLQSSIRHVLIDSIKPNPYQPRTTWNDEELKELADSIRSNGILQPILVRETKAGFEVIAGQRRLRAAKLTGLEYIPALVRDASDQEMLELALVENIHRTNLNPIERASAYQNYITTFSLTQKDAADRLGQDRSVVSNYIRLLDLPQDIKQMLIERTLSMGHARAILSLPTDELRSMLANRALAGRLSVREVERLVRRALTGSVESKLKERQKPAHIADLEKRLQEILGTKVTINARKKGNRGKIIIDFFSLDEFERLTEKMGLTPIENV